MKFDIARQPLVPAFLTLAALAYAAMRGAAEYVLAAALLNGAAAIHPATAVSPEAALLQFQASHPVWARWIAGLLILFTGMCAGRMTIRYNLYSVGTCLAIPLYGAIVCGLAVGSDYLPAFTAAALLALSVKNFARSFCNGYGFDAIFRASLYLGLLPFVSTAALPLLLILPPAVLLFRRTLREAVVAVAGVLLPAFTICYINWGAGGEFLTPLMALGDPFITGKPFALLSAVPLRNLVLLGGIFVLDLLALLFFLSDIYAVGTKSRTILIYNISVLVLTAAVLCGPAATPGAAAFAALPSAVLLPFMFVRIHRGIALLLYLLLLASAVAEAVLQHSI
ncbi:hypothetical protein [Alistipes senegalensis]|uniref:hypothetical protein n=1 Tax=Alistipes senegalensis TaxID=1288121 RepID=UPI001896D3FE|nr:hypothetical protein [Alistipes senegalensis]